MGALPFILLRCRGRAVSADSLFSYFLREESKQRSFQCLNQKAGAFILLVQNFFGSFFAKKEHPVFQQSFQLSTARIPRGLLKKGVSRVFHRKVHRLFKTMHLRFSAVIQRAEILIRVDHRKFCHTGPAPRFKTPHIKRQKSPAAFLRRPGLCLALLRPHTTAVPHLQKKATLRWPFLIGELFSSLCPSAGQHLTAVCRGHSFPEPMFHFAMPFLRLIRTKHASSSFPPCENLL